VRFLPIIPVIALVLGAAGLAACRAAGYDPHTREMVIAGIIATAAAFAGLAPALALRGSPKSTVSQLGLAGTVIHMFLTLLLAVAAVTFNLTRATLPFSLWLLGFYWATLAGVVFAMASLIRHAKDDPRNAPAGGAAPTHASH
jgi:Kef-type K+ transport system membrane component KefB